MAQSAAQNKAQDKALNECKKRILQLRFDKARNIQKYEQFLKTFQTKHAPHSVDYMEYYHLEAKARTPELIMEASRIISIQDTSTGTISEKRQKQFDKMKEGIYDIEDELNTEDQDREDILNAAKNSLEKDIIETEDLRQDEIRRAVDEHRGTAPTPTPTTTHRLKVDSTLKPQMLTQDLKAVACRNWIKKFKLYIQSGGTINDGDIHQKGIICIYLRTLLSEDLTLSIGESISDTNTLEQNCKVVMDHFLEINPLFLRRLDMIELKPAKSETEEAYFHRLYAQVEEAEADKLTKKELMSFLYVKEIQDKELRKHIVKEKLNTPEAILTAIKEFRNNQEVLEPRR